MSDEKTAFLRECVRLLGQLSYLDDLEIEGSPANITTSITTQLSPSDKGLSSMSFRDSVIIYYKPDDLIIVYYQTQNFSYDDVQARLKFSERTPEQVVELFLESNPKLQKSALSLLMGANDD